MEKRFITWRSNAVLYISRNKQGRAKGGELMNRETLIEWKVEKHKADYLTYNLTKNQPST